MKISIKANTYICEYGEGWRLKKGNTSRASTWGSGQDTLGLLLLRCRLKSCWLLLLCLRVQIKRHPEGDQTPMPLLLHPTWTLLNSIEFIIFPLLQYVATIWKSPVAKISTELWQHTLCSNMMWLRLDKKRHIDRTWFAPALWLINYFQYTTKRCYVFLGAAVRGTIQPRCQEPASVRVHTYVG